jgi:hypothetical protein
MDRGVLLDRHDKAWRLIDNLHHSLRGSIAQPSRWSQAVYVDRDPRLGWTFDGVVNDDGSMTLSAGAYYTLQLAHDQMYNARLSTDPHPGPEETRQLRDTVGVFVRNYMELLHEPQQRDAATSALDTGLRANSTAAYLSKVMADVRLDAAYSTILDLQDEDEHPALQAAAEALCEQVGAATETEPDDLRERLQATAPAERWGVLADSLLDWRFGGRLEPLYAFDDRILPEDAARIKALLVKDLKNGFESAAASAQDVRGNGQYFATQAVQRATHHLETFANSGPKPVEPPPHGEEPAYAEVSAIVDRVQRDLSMGRTGDNLAWVLRPGQLVSGWNGDLEATNGGVRDLGEARPDGTLAFDARRVLAPLAAAHTAPRPLDAKLQADVRQAFVVVAREAARLCAPSDPESQSDPAARAMEDGLVRRYAEWEADRLMADFGYGEPEAESKRLTAADRAVSVLTKSIGQIARLTEQDVVSQLLTTRRSDRFAKAVALGLGKDAPRRDTAAQRDVDAILVPKVQAAFAQIARPESRFGFLTGNRAERGEILGTQAATQIAEAKQYYASLPKGGGGADLRDKSQAAAMTGQPAPGSQTASSATHNRPVSNKDGRGAGNELGGR